MDEPGRAFDDALRDDDPESLYESAPCGYLSTTPDGLVIKINQTLLTWTGYRREEVVGRRTFVSLLSGGGRIYHETHYAPLLRMHGRAREIALDLVRADGSSLPVLVNAVVVPREGDGAPGVVRAAVFDATERRAYERELVRAKQLAEESEARARQLGRTLQQTLIPPAPPEIPGLEVAAAYRPAGSGDEVGGDFYDVFQIREGEWCVVVGDVRGKGVDAAVVTALVRHAVRAAVVPYEDVVAALHMVNDILLRDEADRFCTVSLLRLTRTRDGWSAVLGSAGHPLPVLLTPGGDPIEWGVPGTLLGVTTAAEFVAARRLLGPGDLIALYTDGVTEGRRGGEFFEDRLLDSLDRRRASAQAAVDGLMDDVLAFQGGNPRDDIAIVAIRVP